MVVVVLLELGNVVVGDEPPAPQGEMPPRIPSTAASELSSVWSPVLTVALESDDGTPLPWRLLLLVVVLELLVVARTVVPTPAPLVGREVLHISHAVRDAGSWFKNVQAWQFHSCF